MNIAIIGCGYVGCTVAQYWQHQKNFLVTATTTTPTRVSALQEVAQKIIVTKGNDSEGLKAVLQNQDVVLLSVGAKGADFYEEAYLQTAKTLASILPEVSSIKQLIYTGTYSVYGDQNGAFVNEESTVAPNSPNGKILQETEEVLLSASNENLRVCILRLGGIYGPGRELIKIFGRVAGTTRAGDGNDISNWIHLDDIVGVIEFARHHNWQGIYNVVDDAHLPSRELIGTVLAKHNLPQINWDASLQSKRQYNAWVSNQKIKDAGYQLLHPQIIFD